MESKPAPEGAELRLALGMRGGVSLAVWIGGACAEIDALRRAADERTGFWWDVLQQSPYSRVVVDVMAGASAGGLNGVLFGSAIRNGFRMEDLLPIWQEVAAVKRLRREKGPWISLFDGDEKFLDVIHEKLAEVIEGQEGQEEAQESYVDLQLSATLVQPIDQAAPGPSDEPLRRSRSGARFHFRHDPAAVPPRRDLEPADVARLALAARATASFPFAFEAAVVRSARPDVFRPREHHRPAPALPAAGDRLVDCGGVFSEARGRRRDPSAPFDDADFVVADGGIVDNIPLGKALDAIRDAPANRPTRRVLVYLHPTGPARGTAATDQQAGTPDEEREVARRGPVAMAHGLLASRVQGESIDRDIEQLEVHNLGVRRAASLRRALLDELRADGAPSPVDLATERLAVYLAQRAGSDAAAVQRLLQDPLGVLGEDPFPVVPGGDPAPSADDRWRAPLAGWTSDQRLQLDDGLRSLFAARLEDRTLGLDVLKGGLGPLTRVIGHLLELAREGEKVATDPWSLGECKQQLYRLGSLLRELERLRQLGWVAVAGLLPPSIDLTLSSDGAPSPWETWLDDSRRQLNVMLKFTEQAASTLCDPTVSDEVLRATYEPSFDACAAVLQAMAAPERALVDDPSKVTDIRSTAVDRLELIAQAILEQLPPLPDAVAHGGTEDSSGAEVIQRILVDGSVPFADRLSAVEVLLLPEHLVGVAGGIEIGFARMSAAAPVIGASRFTRLHEESLLLGADPTKPDLLLPDVKLAGNELASFSAFLEERWRVNDWTWGRMDAVSTLVDLLLGLDRPVDERPVPGTFGDIPGDEAQRVAGVRSASPGGQPDDLDDVRRSLVARRQNEILAEAVQITSVEAGADPGADPKPLLPSDLARWDAGLEDLRQPGSPDLVDQVGDVASVAAQVIGHALPRRIPRITAQLGGVARAVSRRLARPSGPRRSSASTPPPPKPRRGSAGALVGAAGLLGLLVAAIVWAVADHPVSLVVGLLAGVVVASVPGAALLWLAVQPPAEDQPARGTRQPARHLAFVALMVATVVVPVAAVVWQALR